MRLAFGTLDLPDTELAPPLLERYVEAGGHVLDVANVYRDGEASRAVGRWLARGPRDRVALYAKGCHPSHCQPDLVTAEVDAWGADHLRPFSNHFSLAQMVSPPWEGCLALSNDDLRAPGDLDGTIRLDQTELAWLENGENR